MIQIDMDMPKNCLKCPFCDSDNCFVTGNNVKSEYITGIKPNDCPLKECKQMYKDVEDIKTEIEGLKHEHTDVNGYRWWNNAIDNVLHIIRDAVEE